MGHGTSPVRPYRPTLAQALLTTSRAIRTDNFVRRHNGAVGRTTRCSELLAIMYVVAGSGSNYIKWQDGVINSVPFSGRTKREPSAPRLGLLYQ